MEWIKCSERMPEEYEDVIVTDGVDVCPGFYVKDEDLPMWNYLCNSCGGLETHWMPLPAPPVE